MSAASRASAPARPARRRTVVEESWFGAFDATGCGRTDYRDANAGDPKLTITRRAGPANVFSLAVAGALFRPRTGGCYTAGYADFGQLGGIAIQFV